MVFAHPTKPSVAKSSVRWVAHRGYSGRYIENTLPAMQAAIEAGANYLETDIQFTADLQPVLFHDESMVRLAGIDKRVDELLAVDLLRIQLQKNDFTPVIGIQPLTEMLALLAVNPSVHLFLEIKAESIISLGKERTIPKLLSIIKDFYNQLTIISFSIEVLSYIRTYSDFKLGWVIPSIKAWEVAQQEGVLSFLSLETIFAHHRLTSDWSTLLSQEYALVIYEVSETQLADELIEQGVSWIETDYIAEMLAYSQCD